jgi:hypothetical protein
MAERMEIHAVRWILSPPLNNFEWVLGNATLKPRQDPRIREYQVLSRITIG